MKQIMTQVWIFYSFLMAFSLNSQAADSVPSPVAPQPPGSGAGAAPDQGAEPKRTRDMNFEDSVMEGMGKNPLDSIENLEKDDKGKRRHLYKRRPHYKPELRQSVKGVEYQP